MRIRPLLILLLSAASASAQAEGTTTIFLGTNRVTLEVAETAIEQRTGLMHRASLEENRGMLFVFSEPRSVAMWMKNTLIDLDAAFVDACGRILNIETMKKGTLDLHRSQGPALTVIEMNAGWFKRHGVHSDTFIPPLKSRSYCRDPLAQ